MMAAKTPDPIDKYVGSRLRMRRLTLGMTQEQLADRVELTFQQIQKYEKGTNRVGAGRLHAFCQILSVPVHFFFDGAPRSGAARRHLPDPALAYVTDFLAADEGHALMRAFTQITNKTLRRSIVRMVEAIDESDES